LSNIRVLFFNDSNAKSDRKDAALWSKADLMLTDAFVRILKDIKLGRLPNDSISQRKDSVLSDEFYGQQFENFNVSPSLVALLEPLEPHHKGYYLLKAGIQQFLDSADYRKYTMVPSPARDKYAFRRALQTRLYEGGFIGYDSLLADSSNLAEATKKFQRKANITMDGVAGEGTVRLLNTNDRDRFIRIAISMDRYKLLPEKMPVKYIWVNLPSFSLQLMDRDTVRLSSKMICGKIKTRTPVLTSAVQELITYPVWVPPPSIVTKEILPAVKKNPGYLARKGFSLLDSKGEEIDPYTVDWSKYHKAIPYRIVQGSGDANAMGVMKFVFANKYSVYLHDTNQRYLFGIAARNLSHGCVRVQQWHDLASYIIRNDRSDFQPLLDSLDRWLERKEKRSIPIRNKLPVFLRYFTCEGSNGGIVFYDDIYGEDRMLQEKYYAGK
jgi:murein L,D-transpeptidase YcbB/YkuD